MEYFSVANPKSVDSLLLRSMSWMKIYVLDEAPQPFYKFLPKLIWCTWNHWRIDWNNHCNARWPIFTAICCGYHLLSTPKICKLLPLQSVQSFFFSSCFFYYSKICDLSKHYVFLPCSVFSFPMHVPVLPNHAKTVNILPLRNSGIFSVRGLEGSCNKQETLWCASQSFILSGIAMKINGQ